MMKKLLPLFLILLVGYSIYSIPFKNNKDSQKTSNLPNVSTVKIGEISYKVEIADDDNERYRGLSGKPLLAQDEGMLFIFPQKDLYAFWMKDMQFPLDFLWIDDHTIVDITENVPQAVGGYLPKYAPRSPVDKVLEINAGEVKRNQLKVGQQVEIILLNPAKN